MKNTQETYGYSKDECPLPRFKIGDEVLFPDSEQVLTVERVVWDKSFGGWLVVCIGTPIGIHEQNFILAREKDEWVPHLDGLWSWWERKEVNNERP